jgi:hypothetical protein
MTEELFGQIQTQKALGVEDDRCAGCNEKAAQNYGEVYAGALAGVCGGCAQADDAEWAYFARRFAARVITMRQSRGTGPGIDERTE